MITNGGLYGEVAAVGVDSKDNVYVFARSDGLWTLQKKLVAEMRGRIKEDDSSVPSPDGPSAYFRKFREGGQHEIFARMPRDGGNDPATVRRAANRCRREPRWRPEHRDRLARVAAGRAARKRRPGARR